MARVFFLREEDQEPKRTLMQEAANGCLKPNLTNTANGTDGSNGLEAGLSVASTNHHYTGKNHF